MQYFFCYQGQRPCIPEIFGHQHKLIASQPRESVFIPDLFLQAMGNLLKDDVADVVAQGVIDVFEPVQVEKK